MSPFLAALNTPEARIARRAESARLNAIHAAEQAERLAAWEAAGARPTVIEPMTDAERRAMEAGLMAAADKYGARW